MLIPACHSVGGWTLGQRGCENNCQAVGPKEGRDWLMAWAAREGSVLQELEANRQEARVLSHPSFVPVPGAFTPAWPGAGCGEGRLHLLEKGEEGLDGKVGE